MMRPRYADNFRLSLLRMTRNPVSLFHKARKLQKRYEWQTIEAGHVKMMAVYLLYKEAQDFGDVAFQLDVPVEWVQRVVKLMEQLAHPEED